MSSDAPSVTSTPSGPIVAQRAVVGRSLAGEAAGRHVDHEEVGRGRVGGGDHPGRRRRVGVARP